MCANTCARGGDREAVIQDIDIEKNQIHVHYIGGSEDEDEWVPCEPHRVQLHPMIEILWAKVGDGPVRLPPCANGVLCATARRTGELEDRVSDRPGVPCVVADVALGGHERQSARPRLREFFRLPPAPACCALSQARNGEVFPILLTLCVLQNEPSRFRDGVHGVVG